jgi:hypothetical protein
MFPGELKLKIEQLEAQLAYKEEEYTRAIKAHKNSFTLKTLRDEMHDLKRELRGLYDSSN